MSDYVSPYLLLPLRSLEEAREDITASRSLERPCCGTHHSVPDNSFDEEDGVSCTSLLFFPDPRRCIGT